MATPYERDSKMWAMMVSEMVDIKAMLGIVTDLLRHSLLRAGVSDDEIGELITKAAQEHRSAQQVRARKMLADLKPGE